MTKSFRPEKRQCGVRLEDNMVLTAHTIAEFGGNSSRMPEQSTFKVNLAACAMWNRNHTQIVKTIAIIGASNNRSKFGNKAVRAFLQQGYTVFPVNPKAENIEGLTAFKSITDVPVRPQMVSVYLPPPVLLTILPDIAARGCDELWLNPGAESDAVLAEAERLGLNIIQACSIVGAGVSPATL
jgi:predicted CoA-binding protein